VLKEESALRVSTIEDRKGPAEFISPWQDDRLKRGESSATKTLHGVDERKRMVAGERPLRRSVGKAIHQYRMIEDGDRIAVGVSGGKDSTSLLHLLSIRRQWIPIHYDLVAIHIDLGFDGTGKRIEPFLREEGVPYHIEKTKIGLVAHSEVNRENPCFLCARLRRKRLFEITHALGCRKIALAHHRDDIIETLLINMFYAGEFGTMVPLQPLFSGKLSIIRPLALTDESAIRQYSEAKGFDLIESGCPTTEVSSRHHIKAMVAELARKNKRIRGNLFRSMRNIRKDYLP
jgi:tRNA 2-thiocytidine biosynthesis protein TtcA